MTKFVLSKPKQAHFHLLPNPPILPPTKMLQEETAGTAYPKVLQTIGYIFLLLL